MKPDLWVSVESGKEKLERLESEKSQLIEVVRELAGLLSSFSKIEFSRNSIDAVHECGTTIALAREALTKHKEILAKTGITT